jgi:two-component system, response regulator
MTVQGAAEILLVEDNEDDAELAMQALRRRGIAGRIDLVKDGAEAVDYLLGDGAAAASSLRIVFLDLKLPKVSGLEILRRIRQDERTRLVPVVVLTSSREEADLRQAYLLAANSYLVKPVDFEAYMEAVGTAGTYWLSLNQIPSR